MLMTIPEACQFLRQGRSKLYNLINEGKIAAIKSDKKTLIQRSELERFVSSLPPYHVQKNKP